MDMNAFTRNKKHAEGKKIVHGEVETKMRLRNRQHLNMEQRALNS